MEGGSWDDEVRSEGWRMMKGLDDRDGEGGTGDRWPAK